LAFSLSKARLPVACCSLVVAFLLGCLTLFAGVASAQPDWLPADSLESTAADPCSGRMLGALAAPVRETGFDRGQSACLAGSFVVRGRAVAVLDGPELYSRGAALGEIELRWLYLADLELTFGARAIEDRDVRGSEAGEDAVFGPIYAGAAAGRLTRAFDRPLRLAWALRLDLPWTTTGPGDEPTVAASPQVAASLGLSGRLVGHARAGALLGLTRPSGDVETRRALALSADLTWAPARWIAGGLGIEAQTGWHGAALDHLAARGGLRAGGRVRVELAAAAPVAGREPTDLVIELALTVDR
jgi:hypothetical protein